jgi:thiol reductant ABC exporter CydC subunit
VGDVESLEGVFVRAAGPALVAGLGLALSVAILAGRGTALALVAAAGLVLAGALVPWLAWRMGRAAGERVVAHRARLGARLVDTVQGVADLLACGRERDQLDAVRQDGLRLARDQGAATRAAALGSALAAAISDLTCLGVILLAVPAVREGGLGGVELAVVALVTLASFEAVAGLPAAFQGLAAARAASSRVFEILDRPPEVAAPQRPAEAAAFLLEARRLGFHYPGGAAPALQSVSFQLDPGCFVAVVGASGAGKSTLASLILRFWDVPPGTLLLGGRDVRDLDPEAVRARFALVPQRVHLLNDTLRASLKLGRPEASDADLYDALRQAGLRELVAALPEGLDTWVGEQGLRLSGGERQRVALARALLRRADCLLLDEPTAHLDAVTERGILERLAGAREGRAALLITHRLAGLERADEILVLERGRVVERGTYAELCAADGPFARLRALQRADDLVETGGD